MNRTGGQENFDVQEASSNSYNDQAGGQKNLSIGGRYIPIKLTEASWTTDGTTARQIPAGTQVAIYNNNAAVAGLRFGKTNAVTSGAPGTVEAVTGEVSLACKPNDWSYFSAGDNTWLITTAATALVYILVDHTVLKVKK